MDYVINFSRFISSIIVTPKLVKISVCSDIQLNVAIKENI